MVHANKLQIKKRPKSRRIVKLRAPKHYKCNYCHEYFNNTYKLQTHKYIHKPNMIWDCQLCDSIFATERLLSVHRKTHSAP